MNKLKNRKEALIVSAVTFIIWLAVVLLFNDYGNSIGWISFIFGVLAFGVLAYAIVWSDSNVKGKVAIEVYGPTIYFSFIYAIIVAVFSGICMITGYDKWKVIVVINIILLGAFVSILTLSVRNITSVAVATEKISASIENNRDIKKDVQSIWMACTDESIKPYLKELKELVDYSDRMGRASSREYEDKFERQLNDIKVLLSSDCEQEEVKKLILDATNTWKQRNMNL